LQVLKRSSSRTAGAKAMTATATCAAADIEDYNSFECIETYAALEYNRIVSYYNTLNPTDKKAETERLKLINMIVRLKQRNIPLAKYAYLTTATLFRKPKKGDIDEYDGKRGKKVNGFPVKFVMEYLRCSRRTAIDYQLALKIDKQMDVAMAAILAASETVTHNDTLIAKELKP